MNCASLRRILFDLNSRSVNRVSRRYFSAKLSTIDSCPLCQPTPRDVFVLPDDLSIDKTSEILGNVARHHINFLIHTGRSDWPKTIESEEGSLASKLKALLGRGGKLSNPFYNVLINNVSLPIEAFPQDVKLRCSPPKKYHLDPSNTREPCLSHSSATIAPLGLYLPYIPHDSARLLEALVRGFLLPIEHEDVNFRLCQSQRRYFMEEVEFMFKLPPGGSVANVSDRTMILVCGHNERDKRCGIIGPLVANAFQRGLQERKLNIEEDTVGLISHIGGHKFAGNVIIYPSKTHKLTRAIIGEQGGHEDATVSIWYGRVRPEHAQGILKETLEDGRIIKEFLRGIILPNGEKYNLADAHISWQPMTKR